MPLLGYLDSQQRPTGSIEPKRPNNAICTEEVDKDIKMLRSSSSVSLTVILPALSCQYF